MSDSDFLSYAFRLISNRTSDVEEKISRLERAKRAIDNEQDDALTEIKKIKKPKLNNGNGWKGPKASRFDSSRDDAYNTIKKQIHKYDSHISRIDWEIKQLQLQKSSLEFANTIANQADWLFRQGEDTMYSFSKKINELKRRLF